jgi:hypothetical protein
MASEGDMFAATSVGPDSNPEWRKPRIASLA